MKEKKVSNETRVEIRNMEEDNTSNKRVVSKIGKEVYILPRSKF
jgi:hypothetical protein